MDSTAAPVIELSYITIKEGAASRYVAAFGEFKDVLTSLPGGRYARLLRNQARPECFVCYMEWDSAEAKDVFSADPRLQYWARAFWEMVVEQRDEYFDDVA